MGKKRVALLRVKRLIDAAKLPSRAHDAAGLDLYATMIAPVSGATGTQLEEHKEVSCLPGRTYVAKTGVAVEFPAGYFGMIKPRSGLSLRNGMMVGAGVVDNDYRGEIAIIFTVESKLDIKSGDKIAQMVLLPYLNVAIEEVDELNETVRGEDGFGSSGK